MAAAVGALSATKNGGFSPPKAEEEMKKKKSGEEETQLRHLCEDKAVDGDDSDEENEDSKLNTEMELDLGPRFSLKEQLEKDKDDESLRKWKEQLLGSVDLSQIGENKEPEVKIVSLKILCDGIADLLLPIPFPKNTKKAIFSLKEGSRYRLEFEFEVAGNLVSGLTYKNTVWKTGIRVDHMKRMMGTFSPQQEPYTFLMEEETTPSGIFARGSYSARTKFVDDDGKCYLDETYSFEIQKNLPIST